MKKTNRTLAVALVLGLGISLAPFVTSAAYNDVTLTTDTVISVGGYRVDIAGSSAVVQSIVVGGSSFDVTMLPGSALHITSPSANRLTFSDGSLVTQNICSDGVSSLSLVSSSQTTTVTITPTADSCGSSGGGGGSSGGGGGGGSYTPPVTVVPAVSATTATTSTVMTTTTATNTSTAASLQAQIASMLATLSSLRAQLSLLNSGTTGAGAFTKNLAVGSRSADIMRLQKVLNSDPDTQVSATGAGSPGNETTYFGAATKAAIMKFQVKYGLAGPGLPGYGNFGPKTKAKASEIAATEGI